jgi:hypothetical protein
VGWQFYCSTLKQIEPFVLEMSELQQSTQAFLNINTFVLQDPAWKTQDWNNKTCSPYKTRIPACTQNRDDTAIHCVYPLPQYAKYSKSCSNNQRISSRVRLPTDRPTDRQTDRQIGKQTHTHTQQSKKTSRRVHSNTHTHKHRHARTHARTPHTHTFSLPTSLSLSLSPLSCFLSGTNRQGS